MIQYQVGIEVDKKGSCKIAAHKLNRGDANHNEQVLADVFEEHNQALMKRIVEEFKRTKGWKGEYKEMDEKGEYKTTEEVSTYTTNDLLEDLEQDVISEMHPPLEKPTKAQIAWNQAMQWVLERLKTYRRE